MQMVIACLMMGNQGNMNEKNKLEDAISGIHAALKALEGNKRAHGAQIQFVELDMATKFRMHHKNEEAIRNLNYAMEKVTEATCSLFDLNPDELTIQRNDTTKQNAFVVRVERDKAF